MRPSKSSEVVLAVTRAKAKMYEFDVPIGQHIKMGLDPAPMLRLAVGLLGDLAAARLSPRELRPTPETPAETLRFAARFFDSLHGSRLVAGIDSRLLLLAGAAYYLCDMPGSASLLTSGVDRTTLHPGLERVLWSALARSDEVPPLNDETELRRTGRRLLEELDRYDRSGGETTLTWELTAELRRLAYATGIPRDVLLGDTIGAIARHRVETSTWNCLPQYTNLSSDTWKPALSKRTMIRELWPAQRVLGMEGVYRGRPAVVQMPTSAGKSHAIELVIRSAFIAGRAATAVVVAPYRALSREIRHRLADAFAGETVVVTELSDVSQMDYRIQQILGSPTVLVATPEKLAYVLRNTPELGQKVGLLVFDEGHLFDSPARGVGYELLLTALAGTVPVSAQRLLVSAVMSNGMEIGRWLGGSDTAIVSGRNLLPTERTVAFASWKTASARLEFVTPTDPDNAEFFVPRVLDSATLPRRRRERVERSFPDRSDPKSVALSLGLKLVPNGAVAVFCGKKATVGAICALLNDVSSRGLPITSPLVGAIRSEIDLLRRMYERNLGTRAGATIAAGLGVMSHHGSIPHGVRLSVEHAMRRAQARFVVCTSTLAEGVNLPIRYLIVASTHQGADTIRARDFHNLIGRAGRAGMHTEGTVLFADPRLYDRKGEARGPWSSVRQLLHPDGLEPCGSALLACIGPLAVPRRETSVPVDDATVVNAYVADVQNTQHWIGDMSASLASGEADADEIERLLRERAQGFAAIEGFLMSYLPPDPKSDVEDAAIALARKTLAFHLATGEQRSALEALFRTLARNVQARVPSSETRAVFGRTLGGVATAVNLELWVRGNWDRIAACTTESELLDLVWSQIYAGCRNRHLRNLTPPESARRQMDLWLQGESFGGMLADLEASNARIAAGSTLRRLTLEHAVEIGENAFGFEAMSALGAIAEVCRLITPEDLSRPLRLVRQLQSRMRYGLPTRAAVLAFEAGFADRPLAMEVSAIVGSVADSTALLVALSDRGPDVQELLIGYPQYFRDIGQRLLATA